MSVHNTFVGLDVHARSVKAFALEFGTGQVWRNSYGNDPGEVLNWCLTLPGPVLAGYEAGPTGYNLFRVFNQVGMDMVVVAPSKLLPQPGSRVKTDARDAQHLAELLMARLFTPVVVPSVEQEAGRDLFRCREDIQQQFKAATARLGHWLLRRGVVELPATEWNKTRLEALAKLKFTGQSTDQGVFEAYLGDVSALRLRRVDLDTQIKVAALGQPWRPVVEALCCLRGIDTLSGFGLAVEIGDWSRLTAQTIGAYLGLVPSEYSSGQSRQQGSITKTGNTHARRLLVEASWVHKRDYRPAVSPSLQAAWAKVVEPVRLRAHVANKRLHRKWDRFEVNKKKRVVANTAVARELAGFCHDLAVMVT
ncbi:MAG: IS110 family transposase [Micrococcales bacterium]|nr:IS110 family transposase [Micrococcales bacterium]